VLAKQRPAELLEAGGKVPHSIRALPMTDDGVTSAGDSTPLIGIGPVEMTYGGYQLPEHLRGLASYRSRTGTRCDVKVEWRRAVKPAATPGRNYVARPCDLRMGLAVPNVHLRFTLGDPRQTGERSACERPRDCRRAGRRIRHERSQHSDQRGIVGICRYAGERHHVAGHRTC
jgi:hypothetical protein